MALGGVRSRAPSPRDAVALDQIASIVLNSGGLLPMEHPDASEALFRIFDQGNQAELADLELSFCATGSDATVWTTGWDVTNAWSLAVASSAAPLEDWLTPPDGMPFLIIQGLQDRMASPENGRMLATMHSPSRLVELDGAGHAVLPERPEATATAIVSFFQEVEADTFAGE